MGESKGWYRPFPLYFFVALKNDVGVNATEVARFLGYGLRLLEMTR
jgi:hypothetical protein